MNENNIYTKTSAGADEVKSRGRALAPRLRTMLIMVDGQRTLTQLRMAASGLGAPPDFLQQLETLGLIVAMATSPQPALNPAFDRPLAPPMTQVPGSQAERVVAARKLMNNTAVDALGLRAFMFTLKLEKAVTGDDLRLLLPEFTAALTKARGDLFARQAAEQARVLLD